MAHLTPDAAAMWNYWMPPTRIAKIAAEAGVEEAEARDWMLGASENAATNAREQDWIRRDDSAIARELQATRREG